MPDAKAIRDHVIVDGSNIATEGRSLPSLAQLDEAVRAFLEEYPDRAPFGVVLHAGREWIRPARNVVAIPWSAFAGS